jgi:26S proteasome regulatory subunit N12
MATSSLGDVGMTIRQAAEDLQRLKAAYAQGDIPACDASLDALKKRLVFLPTFMDPRAASPTRTQEVMLAREVLEHGVLVATKAQDVDQFESSFAMLRTYYHDLDGVEGVEPSERRLMILGLNLLRLLVVQRMAEFHSDLEAIPVADHKSMFVAMPIRLERYLMEGSYSRLLNARSEAPSNEFLPLVDKLRDTVRESIARCIPDTYVSLSLANAQKMLMIDSAADATAFGQRRQWELKGATFHFPQADDAAARKELDFKALLSESLSTAAQLQQVV